MTNIIQQTYFMIFIPIICSVLIYILSSKKFNYMVFAVQICQTILLFRIWKYLSESGIIRFTVGGWSREIGIELRLDSISFLFLMLAVIIWWIVLLYAWSHKKSDYKFLFFLMFLEGCFNALMMANDFFTLFVLIEIITIISSILILYKKDGISIKAGLYYLLFNSFGMVIYLFGLVFLYLKIGSVNISYITEVISSVEFHASHTYITLSFACFFAAMCVKAAFFPVYDWLPRAHTAAPAYISALLSGLLVKSGIYGLIRLLSVFSFIDLSDFLFYLGFFTAISGFIFAISQKDIKAILAFSTISQIGLIVMSLASNSYLGLIGACLHILSHFFYKSILFLGAGIIINEYGLRRITEIKGIAKAHPLLSLCMIIAILSSTGAPFFVGYYSKSMIKLSLESDIQVLMLQLISMGTVITFLRFSRIFIGSAKEKKSINRVQLFSVVLMTALSLVAFVVELDLLPVFLNINGDFSENIFKHINYIRLSTFEFSYILDYLLLLLGSFMIYKILVRENSSLWYSIRHFRIRFQDAIISLMLFLILIINYL